MAQQLRSPPSCVCTLVGGSAEGWEVEGGRGGELHSYHHSSVATAIATTAIAP